MPTDMKFEEPSIREENNEDIYNKKYILRNYNSSNNFNNTNPINEDNNNSDTSSNNGSIYDNGETLIQNRKIISQPRNYTSQSFFLNKNKSNNNLTQNSYLMNSHIQNQLPMTMKGDFVSLIENNPKLLSQKNARIQVTNATCDLDQIINDDDGDMSPEEIDNEIDKLSNNYIIDKNKVLSKLIKNCDKDLYASQKPFKKKKGKWFSVSIPLNDNEAKWEILNNIKGERDKNNINKFELIQNEIEAIKEEQDEGGIFWSDKKSKNTTLRDVSYKLTEMNFTQFYRSPMKSPNKNEEEKSLFQNKINRIIIPGEKQNAFKNQLNNSRQLTRRNLNILDRSKGKIDLDPTHRSIDYGNNYGGFNDSDSDSD